MQRDALLAAMPSDEALHALNPYQQKKAVEDAIQAVISAIANDHNNPDLWETDHLVGALAAVLSGWYRLALQRAEHALIPPAKRSDQAKLQATEAWSTSRLEGTLQAVRAIPLI